MCVIIKLWKDYYYFGVFMKVVSLILVILFVVGPVLGFIEYAEARKGASFQGYENPYPYLRYELMNPNDYLHRQE